MRLLRLFAASFSLSLRRELAFRADLLFQTLTAGVGVAAALAALGLVYARADNLGGWARWEAVALLGTYQIVSGLLATFIEPNLRWFAEGVTSGKLDDILLKPLPSIFLASLGSCAPLGLSQVVLGAATLWLGLRDGGLTPAPSGVIGWMALLGAALAVTWSSRVLLASLALWVPALSLDVVYGALWQFGRYPVSIYRQPFRFALTYVVPLASIATLPTRTLTRGLDMPVLLAGLALGVAMVVLTVSVWTVGLRRYTSATS